MHPDVYDAGEDSTWNGYRYWMAMTPAPNYDSSYENPSILASADGTTWVVPAGLTNPISPQPPSGANADTELFMEGDTLYCFWNYNNDGENQNPIYYSYSTDGITWPERQLLLTGEWRQNLSPTIIKVGDEYQCYVVDASGATYYLKKRVASALLGPWSDPVAVELHPATTNIWHVNIIVDGDLLYMVYICWPESHLRLGISEDSGDSWYLSDEYLLYTGPTANWDALAIYRSAILRRSDGFDLWYSGLRKNGLYQWHIARSRIFMWPWDENQKQLYVLAEKNNLPAGPKLNAMWKMMRAPGEYRTMPAYINHQRMINSSIYLYEAKMNTDTLTADSFKDRLGVLLEVDPATVGVTTTTPNYAGYGSTKMVFDQGGSDQVSITIYGTTSATWEQSRAECKAHLGI